MNEELANALMGYAGNSTGRGHGRSYSLRKLHEAICRIGYPGVVFPVVVPEWKWPAISSRQASTSAALIRRTRRGSSPASGPSTPPSAPLSPVPEGEL